MIIPKLALVAGATRRLRRLARLRVDRVEGQIFMNYTNLAVVAFEQFLKRRLDGLAKGTLEVFELDDGDRRLLRSAHRRAGHRNLGAKHGRRFEISDNLGAGA